MKKIEMLKLLQAEIDHLAKWTEDAPITPQRLSDAIQNVIDKMEVGQ